MTEVVMVSQAPGRVRRVAAQRMVMLDALETGSDAVESLSEDLRAAEDLLWPEYAALRDDLVLALVRDGRGDILTVERLLSDALAYVWLRDAWLRERGWCDKFSYAFTEMYHPVVVARAHARYAEWVHDEHERLVELEARADHLRGQVYLEAMQSALGPLPHSRLRPRRFRLI